MNWGILWTEFGTIGWWFQFLCIWGGTAVVLLVIRYRER